MAGAALSRRQCRPLGGSFLPALALPALLLLLAPRTGFVGPPPRRLGARARIGRGAGLGLEASTAAEPASLAATFGVSAALSAAAAAALVWARSGDASNGEALAVVPFLGACGGAEVTGLNLRAQVPAEAAARVRVALRQHGVLVFRGQPLREADVLRAAKIFGQPEPVGDQKFPIALYQVKDRDRVRRGQDFWHADNSYNPHGGGPTLLYGLKIPKGADGRTLGDTQFADAASAAASLPQALRERIEGRRVLHNMAHNGGEPLPEYASGEWREAEDAVHPMLRENPLSGQQTLFVAPAYVRGVEGLAPADSAALLGELYRHVEQPPHTFAHSWREHDLLVWDNSRMWHRATTLELPPGAERLMWRVQTRGPGTR